jgi:hypothetical protein
VAIKHGTQLKDAFPALATATLESMGLREGDIVTVHAHGLNAGGIIYRIAKNCPPLPNAVWGTYKEYRRWGGPRGRDNNFSTREGWLHPKGLRVIPEVRQYGCVELQPVFSFMPHSKTKKVISYKHIHSKVKKVDIVQLGVSFAEFQQFIGAELARLAT